MKYDIRTNNIEVYNKLSDLNHSSQVTINGNRVKEFGLLKIVNNINRHSKKIEIQKIGDNYILRKCNSIKLNVFSLKK